MKLHKICIYLNLVLFNCAVSQSRNQESLTILEERLDSIIQSTMKEQHIPGAAFIVVKDNSTLLKKGYGFNTLGTGMNYINPDSTIFRIGSVTKTFTATALLQLADKEKLDLHEDVNKYLKRLKVPDTYSSTVTTHHILTHSSGFDELKGRRVFQENEQIPLDKFLKNRLLRIRKPGLVSAYSTYGIALGGLMIEDISGLTYEDFLKKNLWNPLGMTMTSLNVPDSLNRHVSLGYELYNGVNIPQPWEWYHTFPASSINSTVTDMGKYMLMHLNKGNYKGHNIFSSKTAFKMQSKQMSMAPESSGFAYGFYERDWQGYTSYMHGGEMLGYSSDLVLIPELNMGIFVVHHHEGTNLRSIIINEIMAYFKKESQTTSIQKELQGDLSEFIGTYRWMSDCFSCDDKYRTWDLTIDENNRLKGFRRTFLKIQPLVFKSIDGERVMSFKRDSKGMIRYMSLGNINTFEKVGD